MCERAVVAKLSDRREAASLDPPRVRFPWRRVTAKAHDSVMQARHRQNNQDTAVFKPPGQVDVTLFGMCPLSQ